VTDTNVLIRGDGLDADAIASVVGGTWLRRPATAMTIHGAAIDSRAVSPGNLFFAFAGERVDGHDFVVSAAKAGGGAVVVERDVAIDGPGCAHTGVLLVGSTRAALRDLAWAFRRALAGVRVIGITGSNGKTTTVRLVHAALKGGGLTGTHATKSHNNELGVPLTILNARPTDDYLICEVGTNAPGEIASLAELVAPDIGVITSIGRAHLEKLGSVAGIAEEKADLVRAVGLDGCAIVTGDSPELDRALERGVSCRIMRVGVTERTPEPGRVAGFEANSAGCSFVFDGRAIRIPFNGLHNAGNAAIACAVARDMGCDPAGVIEGLAGAVPPEMRQEIVDLPIESGSGDTGSGETGSGGTGTIRIVNDAYNANPESVRAAIAMLSGGEFDPPGSSTGRRIAVLGDMLEMGDAARAVHREIAEAVGAAHGIDLGLFVGEAFRDALGDRQRPSMVALEPGDAWIDDALGRLRPGDVVLLKGSRGMRLERLLDALRQTRNPAGSAPTR
jgi:UDP-N-acetylmuramoyl-tripeptide--D-alanyl-D-alanine ligase